MIYYKNISSVVICQKLKQNHGRHLAKRYGCLEVKLINTGIRVMLTYDGNSVGKRSATSGSQLLMS